MNEHISAFIHRADGLELAPLRDDAAGVMRTGTHAGVCPMVVVTDRGSVFYSPAVRHVMMGCDLARSRDHGASFETVVTPRTPQYVPTGYEAPRAPGMRPRDFRWLSENLAPGCTLHPSVWFDRAANRVFATLTVQGANPDGSGSIVAWSDDDGDTWHASATGAQSWDWGKLYFGPPATDESRRALERSGYPHIVYFSATGPTLISGPNQINYKSLDGGRSWLRVADAFDDEQARRFETGFPQRGVVDRDGVIYRSWAGTPREYMPDADKSSISVQIVRSLDEGASWEHFSLPESRASLLGATLAIDLENRLHLAWVDNRDGQVRLSRSNDRAQHWSEPRVLRFPGVEWATKPTIEFGGRGELAIAFWGSSQSQGSGDGWLRKDGRPYDGYLSVCRDFDAAEPTFSTLRARAGDGALIPDGESVFSSGEYLGQPAFGPDGSVWAGFLGKHVGGIVARLLPDCSRN